MALPIVVLSTLQNDILLYKLLVTMETDVMTSFVLEHGRQCMPCSVSFSMTLQMEILSTGTSDFLKQMIILKSLYSVFF